MSQMHRSNLDYETYPFWTYLPVIAIAPGTIRRISPKDPCHKYLPEAAERAALSYNFDPAPQHLNATTYVMGNCPRKQGLNVEYLPHIRTGTTDLGSFRSHSYDQGSTYRNFPLDSEIWETETMLASCSDSPYQLSLLSPRGKKFCC